MQKSYFKLNKKDKKKYKEKFLSETVGKNAKYFLNSSLVNGLLCLIFGLYILIDAIIKNSSLLEKIWGVIVFAFGEAFIVIAIILFYKKLNQFINKK